MALWRLLFFTRTKKNQLLWVASDLKTIIDWAISNSLLQVSILDIWMENIKRLQADFLGITFQHVYMEYNEEVDRLSKIALHILEGYIFIKEFNNENEPIYEECLQIYHF